MGTGVEQLICSKFSKLKVLLNEDTQFFKCNFKALSDGKMLRKQMSPVITPNE